MKLGDLVLVSGNPKFMNEIGMVIKYSKPKNLVSDKCVMLLVAGQVIHVALWEIKDFIL